MKKYEFWFVVGSQFLYGPEVLETVEQRAKQMAEKMSEKLPYPLVFKGVVKTADGCTGIMKEANRYDECAGIVGATRSPCRKCGSSAWSCYRGPGAISLRSTTATSPTRDRHGLHEPEPGSCSSPTLPGS